MRISYASITTLLFLLLNNLLSLLLSYCIPTWMIYKALNAMDPLPPIPKQKTNTEEELVSQGADSEAGKKDEIKQDETDAPKVCYKLINDVIDR